MSDEQRVHSFNTLMMLVDYLAEKGLHEEVDNYVRPDFIRPFVTPLYVNRGHVSKSYEIKRKEFTEYIVPIRMQESSYNEELNKSRLVTKTYQARVAVYEGKADRLLFTNWDAFYQAVTRIDSPEAYREKLEKKARTHLQKALYDEQSTIRFTAARKPHPLVGLSLKQSADQPVREGIAALLEYGKSIISEIRTKQGMRKEQAALNTVWIRQ